MTKAKTVIVGAVAALAMICAGCSVSKDYRALRDLKLIGIAPLPALDENEIKSLKELKQNADNRQRIQTLRRAFQEAEIKRKAEERAVIKKLRSRA